MKLIASAVWLIMLIMSWGAPRGAFAAESKPARSTDGKSPIYTRERIFSIPFYLNPNSKAPDEIQLFASGNRGRKWELYQRRRADQHRFDFQAAGDGEYWFVVRTNQDQQLPSQTTKPEKIVVVDQTSPDLELRISRTDSGQMQGQWEAKDEHLDPGQFKLSYRLPGEETWNPIAVTLPSPDDFVGTQWSGDVSWTVPRVEGEIEVRAEIADQAGNGRNWEQPISIRSPDAPVDSESLAPITSTRTPKLADDAGDLSWRTERDSPSATKDTITASSSTSAKWTSSFSSNDELGTAENSFDQRPTDAISGNNSPPDNAGPSTADIQLTNASRIELDYDVKDAGPQGVSRVELWITDNSGLSWRAYGIDNDLTSPFAVELPGEGTFGFRLLIHDKQGRSAPAPQPGDRADLWIGADRTPPQVRITDAFVEQTEKGTLVRVNWAASDAHLVEQPVRIQFRPGVEGPWADLFQKALPNTGSHSDVTTMTLGPQVYLRIEVSDRAGNKSYDVTKEPIATGGQPQGTIRSFRAVSQRPEGRSNR